MSTSEDVDSSPMPEGEDERDHPPDKVPARKWLYDRINGKSRYGETRPPCRMCWVPPPVGW